ncbi:MAG: hypothetical protein ACRD1V_17910 [Vicinamibacterales bacterium]
MQSGEVFTSADLGLLLVQTFFPEKTNRESAIILDYLHAHGAEFDRFAFSVRVGEGTPVDPTHDPGIQKTTKYSSQKRIDMLLWQGPQPWLFEIKYRLVPAALGQLHAYALLWQRDNPNARRPKLVAIGRSCDLDTRYALDAHGVDIYIYPEAVSGAGAADSAVPSVDAPAET